MNNVDDPILEEGQELTDIPFHILATPDGEAWLALTIAFVVAVRGLMSGGDVAHRSYNDALQEVATNQPELLKPWALEAQSLLGTDIGQECNVPGCVPERCIRTGMRETLGIIASVEAGTERRISLTQDLTKLVTLVGQFGLPAISILSYGIEEIEDRYPFPEEEVAPTIH